MNAQLRRAAGFTLLPVILVMTLIAAVAYLLNRDNGINAAMVASQGDQDRARYAAEAGLQAVNADIQTRNCSGTYPSILSQKTNSNFGGASYAAYAIIPWGNVTSLSSTGTYNGTSVTLTRSNVIAYQLAPQSYTLQPDAAGGIDTYIEINKTWNDGKGAVLWAGSNYDIPMLKFDLSMFPAGSLPLAATLSLFQLSGSNGSGTKSIHRMTANWVEGTGTMNPKDGATWFTSDGSALWTFASIYHLAALASVPYIAGSSFWETYDVTDLAAAWMTGRYANFGVLLMMSPAAGAIKYASSDANTAASWPKLDFSYLLPCGATGPTNTPPPQRRLRLRRSRMPPLMCWLAGPQARTSSLLQVRMPAANPVRRLFALTPAAYRPARPYPRRNCASICRQRSGMGPMTMESIASRRAGLKARLVCQSLTTPVRRWLH